MVFSAFFEFLGPAVDKLNYWGSKEGVRKQHRSRKLDSALVKLVMDLAFRFGLSSSTIHYHLAMFLIPPSTTWKKLIGCQLLIKCWEHYHQALGYLYHY